MNEFSPENQPDVPVSVLSPFMEAVDALESDDAHHPDLNQLLTRDPQHPNAEEYAIKRGLVLEALLPLMGDWFTQERSIQDPAQRNAFMAEVHAYLGGRRGAARLQEAYQYARGGDRLNAAISLKFIFDRAMDVYAHKFDPIVHTGDLVEAGEPPLQQVTPPSIAAVQSGARVRVEEIPGFGLDDELRQKLGYSSGGRSVFDGRGLTPVDYRASRGISGDGNRGEEVA